jgi:hypothetical protein
VISGTPAGAGVQGFVVRCTDSAAQFDTQSLSITINAPGSLTITTPSLPAATEGQPYSQPLAATGGTPPYSWSVTAGALPPGVTLSGAGVIAGTPMAGGTFNFTAAVSDSAAGSASQPMVLTIDPASTTGGSSDDGESESGCATGEHAAAASIVTLVAIAFMLLWRTRRLA